LLFKPISDRQLQAKVSNAIEAAMDQT
jgi:hypothetical protein